MKNWIFVACLVLSCCLQNCSTDFDINGEYRETSAVYALLDASESVHYVRIDRAFLSGNESALLLAIDPNQIYYGDELKARIEEYSGGSLVATYDLQRVDGDTLGIPKQEGIFADIPNILYRFSTTLNQDHSYKIVATDTLTNVTFSAQTEIVNTFKVTNPNDDNLFPQSFNISPPGSYSFKWISAKDAIFYDLFLRFEYREGIYDDVTGVITFTDTAYVDWKFASNFLGDGLSGGSSLTFKIEGSAFYDFIQKTFQPDANPNVVRIADSVKFLINAGGQELYNYYLYTNSSLGITEGQIGDIYTNVENGLGVFSSRFHRETKYYVVSSQTRDSIACSVVTQGLNFAPESGSPGFPFCSD